MDYWIAVCVSVFVAQLRHAETSRRPHKLDSSSWEHGLKEATYRVFAKEGWLEPGLRAELRSAPIVGESQPAVLFGDVSVLARGQLRLTYGNLVFVKDESLYDCDNCQSSIEPRGKTLMLWSVKRLRHRKPSENFRYEVEYKISPVKNGEYLKSNGRFNYDIPGHIFLLNQDIKEEHNPFTSNLVNRHYLPPYAATTAVYYYTKRTERFTTVEKPAHRMNLQKEIELYNKLLKSLKGNQKVTTATTTPIKSSTGTEFIADDTIMLRQMTSTKKPGLFTEATKSSTVTASNTIMLHQTTSTKKPETTKSSTDFNTEQADDMLKLHQITTEFPLITPATLKVTTTTPKATTTLTTQLVTTKRRIPTKEDFYDIFQTKKPQSTNSTNKKSPSNNQIIPTVETINTTFTESKDSTTAFISTLSPIPITEKVVDEIINQVTPSSTNNELPSGDNKNFTGTSVTLINKPITPKETVTSLRLIENDTSINKKVAPETISTKVRTTNYESTTSSNINSLASSREANELIKTNPTSAYDKEISKQIDTVRKAKGHELESLNRSISTSGYEQEALNRRKKIPDERKVIVEVEPSTLEMSILNNKGTTPINEVSSTIDRMSSSVSPSIKTTRPVLTPNTRKIIGSDLKVIPKKLTSNQLSSVNEASGSVQKNSPLRSISGQSEGRTTVSNLQKVSMLSRVSVRSEKISTTSEKISTTPRAVNKVKELTSNRLTLRNETSNRSKPNFHMETSISGQSEGRTTVANPQKVPILNIVSVGSEKMFTTSDKISTTPRAVNKVKELPSNRLTLRNETSNRSKPNFHMETSISGQSEERTTIGNPQKVPMLNIVSVRSEKMFATSDKILATPRAVNKIKELKTTSLIGIEKISTTIPKHKNLNNEPSSAVHEQQTSSPTKKERSTVYDVSVNVKQEASTVSTVYETTSSLAEQNTFTDGSLATTATTKFIINGVNETLEQRNSSIISKKNTYDHKNKTSLQEVPTSSPKKMISPPALEIPSLVYYETTSPSDYELTSPLTAPSNKEMSTETPTTTEVSRTDSASVIEKTPSLSEMILTEKIELNVQTFSNCNKATTHIPNYTTVSVEKITSSTSSLIQVDKNKPGIKFPTNKRRKNSKRRLIKSTTFTTATSKRVKNYKYITSAKRKHFGKIKTMTTTPKGNTKRPVLHVKLPKSHTETPTTIKPTLTVPITQDILGDIFGKTLKTTTTTTGTIKPKQNVEVDELFDQLKRKRYPKNKTDTEPAKPTTENPGVKIIYSNFYEASTENPADTNGDVTTDESFPSTTREYDKNCSMTETPSLILDNLALFVLNNAKAAKYLYKKKRNLRRRKKLIRIRSKQKDK